LKPGGGSGVGRSQIQWAALLAIAVVLPTISLLWFMNRVIANERLVVRQKLAALYQDKLTDATTLTETLVSNRLTQLARARASANPYSLIRRLIMDEGCLGAVIWSPDGSLVYPLSADAAGNDVAPESPLAEAWQREFAAGRPDEAAALYTHLVQNSDPQVALAARLGRSRCLAKLGRLREAIEQCQQAAFAELPALKDPTLRLTIENARLMLLSMIQRSSNPSTHSLLFAETIDALNSDLFNATANRPLLPANQNLFIARKVLAVLDVTNSPQPQVVNELARLTEAEVLSLAAAESPALLRLPHGQFVPATINGKSMIVLRHRGETSTTTLLMSDSGVASLLTGYDDAFAGSAAAFRVSNGSGMFVAGKAEPEGKPFLSAALPTAFPGWKVELYFEGGDVFEQAARRQIAVYLWTGALVIALILIAGGFATQAVGKQIRLNRMKNDFIATVSHELKTPLASMRVLVDTLLEGRIRDEEQGREYLRMTAKENERLSRMIDNFLTFSRMERNKVSFAMDDVRAGAIVSDAVESVKTKLAGHQCDLTVEIADGLQEIQADHDAMVTVLVNLLDNACKYTTANKRVSVKVFEQNGWVHFAVSDNGIGIARRHLRKIFDRFYQVDNSLARKTEGCGLGLSIVKFIVDAHRGKITVESKPDQGSTFTVRVPAGLKNHETHSTK
jgi:signal transduction histidine kinase/tetratricopeptide (TPR) repeat protein